MCTCPDRFQFDHFLQVDRVVGGVATTARTESGPVDPLLAADRRRCLQHHHGLVLLTHHHHVVVVVVVNLFVSDRRHQLVIVTEVPTALSAVVTAAVFGTSHLGEWADAVVTDVEVDVIRKQPRAVIQQFFEGRRGHDLPDLVLGSLATFVARGLCPVQVAKDTDQPVAVGVVAARRRRSLTLARSCRAADRLARRVAGPEARHAVT